jgi:hypothetical protein
VADAIARGARLLMRKDSGLTDERKANLTANYEAYVARIVKLKAELGEW